MKEYFYLALSWFFGLSWLLAGIVMATNFSLRGGACILVMSSLILPPIRNWVFSKTNKTISKKVRILLLVMLFIATPIFVVDDINQRTANVEAERVAAIEQENIDYFNSNREQIISAAKSALDSKNYQTVVVQFKKYIVSGDRELNELYDSAKIELAKLHKTNETKRLLAELKTVPTKKYAQNRKLYEQLVSLHPENERFKNKLSFYSKKVEENRQKQRAATAREERIERQFSVWDGSHRNLERYILTIMNDPDSYDHEETVYWDRGSHLIVKTTFRGRNAFGGMVLNSIRAKVALDGEVLEILE